MPFRGRWKQNRRNGVDLIARTAEIERLAADGVYHFDIAKRLGCSVSTVEQSIRMLREGERLGSMRGPRAKVAKVDWDVATRVWFDLTVEVSDAVRRIGCAERTIYRKLGSRCREVPSLPPAPKEPRPATKPRPFTGLLAGPDPFRAQREKAMAEASKGRL